MNYEWCIGDFCTDIETIGVAVAEGAETVYDFYAEDPVKLPVIVLGWPVLLLGGGCALDTSGTYSLDAADGADADAFEGYDNIDAEFDDVPDGFEVDTADVDYVETEDGADEGETTGPCTGNLPPRSFHLLSPAPGEVDVSTRTIFEWGPAIDPEGDDVRYTLTYDHDGDPLTAARVTPPLDRTTYDPADDLPFEAIIDWSVSAFDEPCGNETEGISPRSFTTRAYPICSETVDDTRLTNAAGDSRWQSVVWNGSEYRIAWQDNRNAGNEEIYFMRLLEGGIMVGAERRITTDLYLSESPAIASSGAEDVVCWSDNRVSGNKEIYCNRLNASGTPILTDDIRITDAAGDSEWPVLAFTGTEFGISWSDSRLVGNKEIYFNRLASDGTPILPDDVLVSNASGDSEWPSLAWAGTGFGLAWHDNRYGNNEIIARIVDPSGIPLGTDGLRVTSDPGNSRASSIASTGSGFGVAWFDDRVDVSNIEVFFNVLDSSGAPTIIPDVRVTNAGGTSGNVSLIRSGTYYAASWHDNREGSYDIYFRLINGTGTLFGPEIRVTTDDINDSYRPILAWTGNEYGIVWWDDRDGNSELYFAGITCEP